MKTRQEIKATAKLNFSYNYLIAVGGTILVSLIISAGSSLTFGLGAIFLFPPLYVGLCFFSLSIYRGVTPSIETIFSTGFSNYWRKVGSILWMQLFTFLWTLRFIIPGIIKSFAYAMTPYILADYPQVPATEAIKISMKMTQGHKGEIFIMYLSFIGWMLLSALSFGIVGIFYSFPYINTSIAGLYDELKDNAFANGIIQESDLI